MSGIVVFKEIFVDRCRGVILFNEVLFFIERDLFLNSWFNVNKKEDWVVLCIFKDEFIVCCICIFFVDVFWGLMVGGCKVGCFILLLIIMFEFFEVLEFGLFWISCGFGLFFFLMMVFVNLL